MTPTPTPVPDLLITNLSRSDYIVVPNDLQATRLIYVDRDYVFKDPIPEDLFEKTYIRTANDDKNLTSTTLLSFDVNQSVIIYVAIDERIGPLPSWLVSWSPTDMRLKTTDLDAANRKVYRKIFSQGTITLGPNRDLGMPDDIHRSMYTVIITPLGSTAQGWSKYQ